MPFAVGASFAGAGAGAGAGCWPEVNGADGAFVESSAGLLGGAPNEAGFDVDALEGGAPNWNGVEGFAVSL